MTNILGENIKIPSTWRGGTARAAAAGDDSGPFTQRRLLQKRRLMDIPDPSYDLDGDGHVSQTDLFFAKRFDLD